LTLTRDPAEPSHEESLLATIDVGFVRMGIGGPHGAFIDLPANLPATRAARRRAELLPTLPPLVIRATAVAEIWSRFDRGAAIVHINAPPGAGTTTLLRALAADAPNRGFVSGALLLTDVRGPARDAAARIAALLTTRDIARYSSASELLGLADGMRCVVLLDRAALTGSEALELAALFPSFRFAIACAQTSPDETAVVLGPLPAGVGLTILETAYGRLVDADNRPLALELLRSVGSLPEPARLLGAAARELRRSFISLQLEFGTGDAIVRQFIAGLPSAQARILAIMALAQSPLAAYQIAYVARSGEIDAPLQHLIACDLVTACGTDLYELPRYVAERVPPAPVTDPAFGRVVDVLCDAFDPSHADLVLDRQLAAAERLLHAAATAGRDRRVLALGGCLAPLLATRGAFGAWGRVLNAMRTAAERIRDRIALADTNHELGVRAIVSAENDDAFRFLRIAARDRAAAGDEAGAAASTAALALADRSASAIPAAAPATAAPDRQPAAGERGKLSVAWLLTLFAGCVAVSAFSGLAIGHRVPAAPEIRDFSVHPVSVAGGRAFQLCVDAANTAVVEIFPDAMRLPGDGAHCVVVRPLFTTTYVAVGTAAEGERVRRAVTVAVDDTIPPAPRIALFSAVPARIEAGHSTRLCYAVTGAHLLRIVPRVGPLTRLTACRTVTLHEPHRYNYLLSATGDDGRMIARSVQVVVVAPSSPLPARAVARDEADRPDERAARNAVFQFDATPAVVERGQSASLCVGIDRPAHGFVTHLGPLQPGITRCYRVAPPATTVYRLVVGLQNRTAVESVTVAVRPNRVHDVARNEH
jgi:hypothetical protein